jgi:hypothetical protein
MATAFSIGALAKLVVLMVAMVSSYLLAGKRMRRAEGSRNNNVTF